MDESFHFFFTEISSFSGQWYERGGRNVDGRNFTKFRLKSAKNGCKRKIGKIFKNMLATAILSPKFWFVSPIFREISRYFLPVQPTHRIQNHSNLFFIMICRQGCVFQPSSKIMDLGFVKFKSNGTKAKRP